MGRRPPNPAVVAEADGTAEDTANGEDSVEAPAPLTTAQRLAASAVSTEIPPDSWGRQAKHFTETRVLNRDVSHLLFQFFPSLESMFTIFHHFLFVFFFVGEDCGRGHRYL
jgi:hypothetical protein